MQLISEDGYSTGEATILYRGKLCAYVDTSKNGERWRVIADNRLDAVVELMEMLGWSKLNSKGNFWLDIVNGGPKLNKGKI